MNFTTVGATFMVSCVVSTFLIIWANLRIIKSRIPTWNRNASFSFVRTLSLGFYYELGFRQVDKRSFLPFRPPMGEFWTKVAQLSEEEREFVYQHQFYCCLETCAAGLSLFALMVFIDTSLQLR
jgi:hypothetical protein